MTRVNKTLLATAHHEAGHVVVARSQGRAARGVTIVPDEDTLGSCSFYRLRETGSFAWHASARNRIRLEQLIISALGGCAAEARFVGRHNWIGAHNDWRFAADLSTYQAGGDEEADAYLNWLWERTRNIFRLDHWWGITTALADALVERRTLSAPEVRSLLRF